MLVVAIIAIAPASLNLNRALSLSTLTAFRTPWFTTTTLRVRSSVDGGGGGLAEEKIRAPAKIQIYRNLLDPKDTETIWI